MYRRYMSTQRPTPRYRQAWMVMVILAFTLMLATACTSPHSGKTAIVDPIKEDRLIAFNNNLEMAYRHVFNEYGFPTAAGNFSSLGYMDRKYDLVQKNVLVLPEAVEDYNLPYEGLNEFYDYRLRLLAAMNRNARLKASEDAAFAQAYFDCWIAQAANKHLNGGNAVSPVDCHACFLQHLAKVEDAVRPTQLDAPQIRITLKEPQAPAPQPKDYMIFFEFDKADLTKDAAEIVRMIASEAKRTGEAARLQLVGHADTVGTPTYNMTLSQRRADTVKRTLVSLGITEARIATQAKGETQLRVSTKDNVREAQNRRVEATLLISPN